MSELLIEFKHNFRKLHIEKSNTILSVLYFKNISKIWMLFDKIRVQNDSFTITIMSNSLLIDILIKSKWFEYERYNNTYVFRFTNEMKLFLI